MKTLYIERSTGDCRSGDWVEKLDLDGVGRIVVGTGPGSFAGIRSALAFAQGYALGRPCEVFGMPSPCALAAQAYAGGLSPSRRLAVVGDARRGKLWMACFCGHRLEREILLVDADDLVASLPADCDVVTPDAARIGVGLAETLGARYRGGDAPTANGLRLFAEACPGVLTPEPLPIYLSPAVR